MSTYRQLLRVAQERHKAITGCSNAAARKWIEGEVSIVKGKRRVDKDRLYSLDHCIANLVATDAMERGMAPGQAKRFVFTKLKKHYNFMFKYMRKMARENGTGVYTAGDLRFIDN